MEKKTKIEMKTDILSDVDSVLADESKMREIVKDPELVVEVMKEKGMEEMDIVVDGEPVRMVYVPPTSKSLEGFTQMLNPTLRR